MTKLLPLLLLLALPARADKDSWAAKYGPISEEIPQFKRSPKMGGLMKEKLKAAKPETKKLVDLFAKHKAERCGVCPARQDAGGVYCAEADGLFDNCGYGCGKEILLIPAAELAKVSTATLKTGDLQSLVQYGALKNGRSPDQFRASAVATCR